MTGTMCTICCELGTLVNCHFCHFDACSTCVSRYIESRVNDLGCMSCRALWSPESVIEKFIDVDRQWVKHNFYAHLGRCMMEREKALLPETQAEAAVMREVAVLRHEFNSLPTIQQAQRKFRGQAEEVCEKIKEQKRELRKRINDLLGDRTPKHGSETKPKVHYTARCQYDNCRGFVESSTNLCGTCRQRVCTDCHMPRSDVHTCAKEDLDSAAIIRAECRNCPKCMVPIFKSGGCDQMFCTACHVAFSWTTGCVEVGAVHNPHFYEWLASTNARGGGEGMTARQIEDVACGDVPNVMIILQMGLYRSMFLRIHQILMHLRNAVLPEYNLDPVTDNKDLRLQYLLNNFDEETWCIKLANREKKLMKRRAIARLLTMTDAILADFVRRAVVSIRDTPELAKLINEYLAFIQYYSESLTRIVKVHGGREPPELKFQFIFQY